MKSIEEIINEGTSDMKPWDVIEEIKDTIGAEKFLEELCRAMSDDELKKNLKFIARNYEINIKL